MADAHLLPDRILFGAAFYDEYRVNGDLERDLDLMVEASFSVIRVGESVWATWEPEPGVYHLDWLQPVLDGAHVRGISVVLGTPTYAVPPWLRAMDPDLAGEQATGVRHPWGRPYRTRQGSRRPRDRNDRLGAWQDAAQVALRWIVQQPNIAAIPRTSNVERLAAVFDFTLTAYEMAKVAALAYPDSRLVNEPQWVSTWD